MSFAANPSRGTVLRWAGAMALFAGLHCFSPPSWPASGVCAFHWLTGHPCPLCGLTRAMFALGKGRLADAVHWNALSPLAFAMIFGLFSKGPWTSRLWILGVAAFAIYGVLRLVLPI